MSVRAYYSNHSHWMFTFCFLFGSGISFKLTLRVIDFLDDKIIVCICCYGVLCIVYDFVIVVIAKGLDAVFIGSGRVHDNIMLFFLGLNLKVSKIVSIIKVLTNQ